MYSYNTVRPFPSLRALSSSSTHISMTTFNIKGIRMGQGRNHEFIIHLIIFFTSLLSLYIVRASVLKLTHSLDQEPELYNYTRVCQLSHYYLKLMKKESSLRIISIVNIIFCNNEIAAAKCPLAP